MSSETVSKNIENNAESDKFEFINERIDLAVERFRHIVNENELDNISDSDDARKYKAFFIKQANLLLLLNEICDACSSENEVDIRRLKEWNELLYSDIKPDEYGTSYCNPDYACKEFGKELGQYLCAVASEMRSIIGYAFEGDKEELLIRLELLLELHTAFIDACDDSNRMDFNGLDIKVIHDIIYWYVSDYSDEESLKRVKELVDYNYDFATKIILESDLANSDYLYKYGEYINSDVEKLAIYMAGLDDKTIDKIADTYTEGYRIGFINTGKDLSIKETVNIRYPLGMERVVRKAIKNFEAMGLKPVIYRAGNSFFRRQGTNKIGYYGANPNKQYDFDHKEDEALFLDGNFVTRKLECLESAFEAYKDKASKHAGPAVIEDFGEEPADLKTKEMAICLSEEQQKLSVKQASKSGAITNRYIKGEERSFTIIAFPSPAIGEDFEKIFDETIIINTLDYQLYSNLQQNIIDALDKGQKVHIKGMNGNCTDLTVALVDIQNPDKETKFENCVADVNIPVGEVFTSPKLTGTEGVLNVSSVYLNGLLYKNLTIEFKDGKTANYSCTNYENPEDNKKYIKDNVLFHHDSLPIGEFAIGTNTYAYVVGRKYNIQSKLPILIAEKTGPHFAVGDTCYSHAEDVKVYNPNGKEIIARDNEVSLLRKTDMEKAYFNCHTDITIPYDELGLIEVITENGDAIKIIENGRFVLPGSEELNEALDNA